MPESRAIHPCEPCQGRKAAALSSRMGVPRGCPGGAACECIACGSSVKSGCAAFVNLRADSAGAFSIRLRIWKSAP